MSCCTDWGCGMNAVVLPFPGRRRAPGRPEPRLAQPGRGMTPPRREPGSLAGELAHRHQLVHPRYGRDPGGLVAVAPGDHRRPRYVGHPGDLRVRHPVGSQQDHPRPLSQTRRHARQPRQITQLLAVARTQDQGRGKGHAPLSRQSHRETTYDTRLALAWKFFSTWMISTCCACFSSA